MLPFINLVLRIIDLYTWVLIASAILSWLMAFGVVNTYNRFVATIADVLYRLTEPLLRPIRSILPNFGGIDLSFIVLWLLLYFIRDMIVQYAIYL
ncbi:MAG TPA: YggT family protein [Stellaceae bacterium]|nr:YggT family protein [Stellaceae bacterium]